MLGDGVLEDARYKEFMSGFADHTQHFVSAPGVMNDPMTFTSAAFSQLRLNQLDSDMFPLTKFSLTAQKNLSEIPQLPPRTEPLKANVLSQVYPAKAHMTQPVSDKFHPFIASDKAWKLPGKTQRVYKIARQAVSSELAKRKGNSPKPGDDLVVIPLGTSSATPSRYRNVSSILLQIPDRGYVLLDAGEGTWGQLCRFFGTDSSQPNNVWDVLRDLRCIHISHAHADHHAGLAKILSMRQQLSPPPQKPLFLLGVYAVHLYLREWSDFEDLGLAEPSARDSTRGVLSVLTEAIVNPLPKLGTDTSSGWRNHNESRAVAELLRVELGLDSLRTTEVKHRTKAFALVMVSKEGWKVVYSGDTMPTRQLVEAGKDATLLIHEATMGDDQEELAKLKAHSTIGQAISIGKQMGAENVLLTHFSTRYPHVPSYVVEGNAKGPKIAIAFDHARMRLGDFWKMPLYLTAIEQSFADTREEGDEAEEKDLLRMNIKQ